MHESICQHHASTSMSKSTAPKHPNVCLVRLAEVVVTKRIGRTDRKTLSILIDSVGLESSLFRIITAWIVVTNGHHRWCCYSRSVTGLASTK